MERKPRTGLAILAGMLFALVLAFHQAGRMPQLAIDWSEPVVWARSTAPEAVVAAALRQIGLVIGYWVALSTVVYTIACAIDSPPQWVRFVTLPVVRRLVDRSVAASVAFSLLGTPAVPAVEGTAATGFEVAGDGIPIPHVRVIDPAPDNPPPENPAPDEPAHRRAPPLPAIHPTLPPASMPSEPLGPTALVPPAAHLVVRGDNLWTIAAAHLYSQLGPGTDAGQIAAYWGAVIAANESTLRSGDPNLIYPGEIITMPVIEDMP